MPAQTRTRSATKAAPVTEQPFPAAKSNGGGKTRGKGKATALPPVAQPVDEDEDEDDEDLEVVGSEDGSEDDSEDDSDSGEDGEGEGDDDDEANLEQDDSDGSEVDEAPAQAASKASTSRPPRAAPHSQAPTSSSSSSSSSSARLDPSLFKAYFSSPLPSSSNLKSSLKKTVPLAPPTQAELREAREQRKAIKVAKRRREERKGGVVKGRDGLPMRRLGDGRTVVRSLDQPGRRGGGLVDEEASEVQDLPKELYLPASSARGGAAEGDLTNALAAQKSKRFLKRKLGTGVSPLTPTSSSSSATSTASSKKKKKKASSADDPLGLEDPAFLPGGEFAHLGNLTGKKKRRGGGSGGANAVKKPVSKSDLRGNALRGLPGRMGGAAMVFNRSAR